MKIEQQENEQRELELTVHVEEERVQEAIRKTAKRYAKNLKIPGFRPGKAPFHVVRNWVGSENLRAEAVDSITQEIYREAIEQVEVIPFALASLEDIEIEPLVLKITVPLSPTVDLGDYRDVRVEPPEVEVSDDAVDRAMKTIQGKHVLLEPADRPAQEGDVVIASLKIVSGDDVLIDREDAELLLDPEELYPDTPFVQNVIGMSAGDKESFEIDMAEEGEDPRMMTFTVGVQEVKARYVPPLNDDLAKEEGDFETLLDLRIDVRRRLNEQAQQQSDNEYLGKVFDEIRAGATVIYPPAGVEYEIDQMIEDMEKRFKSQNWQLEDYLKSQGQTIEELREELRPQAIESVERGQITRALVEAERLTLDETEVDELIDERMEGLGEWEEEPARRLREAFNSGEGRLMLANDVMFNKYKTRLIAIGRGEAPELPAITDEEE